MQIPVTADTLIILISELTAEEATSLTIFADIHLTIFQLENRGAA